MMLYFLSRFFSSTKRIKLYVLTHFCRNLIIFRSENIRLHVKYEVEKNGKYSASKKEINLCGCKHFFMKRTLHQKQFCQNNKNVCISNYLRLQLTKINNSYID